MYGLFLWQILDTAKSTRGKVNFLEIGMGCDIDRVWSWEERDVVESIFW